MTTPTNTTALVAHAMALIEQARQLGLVLTIETRPRTPLAMGNYDVVSDVRPLRNTVHHMPADDTEGGAA